jgi:hypothetical protein
MKVKSKLPPAAKLLLIEIIKNSVDKVCMLKDRELAKLIDKSYQHTVLLMSKLREAKKIKTRRTGRTEREIIIIDSLI